MFYEIKVLYKGFYQGCGHIGSNCYSGCNHLHQMCEVEVSFTYIITKMYWKWLILVQHNKTKHKSVMGSQNLKENNFETEDSFHFWNVTTFGNRFLTF